MKMSIIFYAVLLAALLNGSAMADDATSDLVSSLLLVREAAVDRVPSGSGLALVSGSAYENGNHGSGPDSGGSSYAIRFKFWGDTSLIEVYPDGDAAASPDKRISATIVENGRVVRYLDAAKHLSIFEFHPKWTLLMLEPVRCTYRDLCRIPDYTRDDDGELLRR